MNIMDSKVDYSQAVKTIKEAILSSQSRAVQMISGTQLSLYFGVGLYVSANSRKGTWGTGAIKIISEQLRRELPGLRGFSEESIKKMRTFSEFWSQYLNRSPLATDLKHRELHAEIECDKAVYYSKLELWKLNDNIEATNLNQEEFYTNELYWNQKEERVYSDSAIKIIQKDRTILGIGFESNQTFSRYSIRQPKGTIPIEE